MQHDSEIDLALDALSPQQWADRLVEIGDEAGYCERLGEAHWAFFADNGPVLLVSFETVDSIRAQQDDQLPMGYAIARARGWSHLSIIAQSDTWFRDKTVYAYFDRMVDDAFFEDFDRVVFYGAGMAGYAAAAYSVAAPGATVLALAPQASLDPMVAGWDQRFRHMRRAAFTDRFGFAPDMMEGAGEGFVIYDPREPLDAMHAALFTRPYVTKLACPNLGADIEMGLKDCRILRPLIEAACEGNLDSQLFWKMYRSRRESLRYLRKMTARLDAEGRDYLNALLCRNVTSRLDKPRFRNRFAHLHETLAAAGITLPPERSAAKK